MTVPLRQQSGMRCRRRPGPELGFAWTIVLDRIDGTMSVTLVNREDAFVLFGVCTPK
jgi:hypothetical protein